jgi:hypothetical protein
MIFFYKISIIFFFNDLMKKGQKRAFKSLDSFKQVSNRISASTNFKTKFSPLRNNKQTNKQPNKRNKQIDRNLFIQICLEIWANNHSQQSHSNV